MCAMPRHPRLLAPGLPFYLMVRGNNKQAIYLDSTDYEEFLAAVERTWPLYLAHRGRGQVSAYRSRYVSDLSGRECLPGPNEKES